MNKKEFETYIKEKVESADGFYHLTCESDPEPVLVHGYFCTDLEGQYVFGFNTHDGGSLVQLSDMHDVSEIIPVDIISKKRHEDLDDIINVQLYHGNWNEDQYMHGLANGMLLGRSTIYGGEYNPLDAPEQYLQDIRDNPPIESPIESPIEQES